MNRRDGDGSDLRGVVTRRLPGTVSPPAIQTPDHSMNAAASNARQTPVFSTLISDL